MEPQDFIQKWTNSPLKERAAAQEHFLDLCRLLGEPTPAHADPTGLDYGFEVGATKTTGGKGFADVFKRGFFGWEYKGTKANLDTAFAQLQRYAIALDNPPLLVVSDIGSMIRIHTNWTNSVSKVYEVPISDMADAEKRAWLKAVFSDPEFLRPKKTRQQLTEEVASDFAKLARSLRDRGNAPELVAHFINRLVFCMFAEDVKLLPENIFSRMLDRALEEPGEFEAFARDLFLAMKSGGRVGFERVAWFNGGLFDDDLVIGLNKSELKIVRNAAAQYWGDVDPSILGTLFERGLDPDKRSQLGAHYTDREKIMMIINPVIVEPLAAEWETAKVEITLLIEKASAGKGAARTKAKNQAQAVLDGYLKRLAEFRVLDPACGSGNFLYLALRSLKDLEHKAQVEAEALGLPRGFPRIGPEVVAGIEINPYAAELARVSIWIGEIQWMLKNGFAASQNPILKPLNNIECRDALITSTDDSDGMRHYAKALWPKADAIVGNPPFLGVHKLWDELGREYVESLRNLYEDDLTGNADFLMYWFAKSLAQLKSAEVKSCGLVATNSIRSGANRKTLKKIVEYGRIFEAWSDEGWTVEGAAVRVSIVCFDGTNKGNFRLDGHSVSTIYADLTTSEQGTNLTLARPLLENKGIAFLGTKKGGPFDITGLEARRFLTAPSNPDGSKNTSVIFRRVTGSDIVRRPEDRWIIDFGVDRTEGQAAMFEMPFSYVLKSVKPVRDQNKREWRRKHYWLHSETAPSLRKAIKPLSRYIATPRVSKHRIFIWLPINASLDDGAVAFALDNDLAFGILHSKFHELWSLRLGSWLGIGNDPRYTPSTTFETFPFPEGMTPNIQNSLHADDPKAARIADAAVVLNGLRENWLNPAELICLEPEVTSGYPDRIVAANDEAEKHLRIRTLTNLYNARPTWLDHAHRTLDEAVAAAYGWPNNMSDDDILFRLFELNQQRTEGQL